MAPGARSEWLMAVPARQRFYTGLLGLMLLGFFGALAALWWIDGSSYADVAGWLGVPVISENGDAYAHAPLPFFDLAGVLSWGECAAQGVDVYEQNPCDPMGRPFNYGPALLLLLPSAGMGLTLALGVVLELAFLVTLTLVLRPRSAGEFAIAMVAGTSQPVLLAMDRANIDIAIFVMVMGAALLSQKRWPGRLSFYGVALFGAFMKFFPAVLFALLLRERPRALLGLGAAALAAMAGYVFWFGDDIARALAHLPDLIPVQMAGAPILPTALANEMGVPQARTLLLTTGVLLTLIGSLLLLVQYRPALAAIDWSRARYMAMLCGLAVTMGCFLSGMSFNYRFVFLIPVLPGLMALQAETQDRGLRRLAACLVGLVCVCLCYCTVYWDGVLLLGLPPAPLIYLHEILWWIMMPLLGGFLAAFASQSPLFDRLLHDPRRKT